MQRVHRGTILRQLVHADRVGMHHEAHGVRVIHQGRELLLRRVWPRDNPADRGPDTVGHLRDLPEPRRRAERVVIDAVRLPSLRVEQHHHPPLPAEFTADALHLGQFKALEKARIGLRRVAMAREDWQHDLADVVPLTAVPFRLLDFRVNPYVASRAVVEPLDQLQFLLERRNAKLRRRRRRRIAFRKYRLARLGVEPLQHA